MVSIFSHDFIAMNRIIDFVYEVRKFAGIDLNNIINAIEFVLNEIENGKEISKVKINDFEIIAQVKYDQCNLPYLRHEFTNKSIYLRLCFFGMVLIEKKIL